MTDTSNVAALHRWAESNCTDSEVRGAITGGHDCTGLILEYLLGVVAQLARTRGWRSEVLVPGTAAWGRLAKTKARRDPSSVAVALSADVNEAMASAPMPHGAIFRSGWGEVRRFEFAREGSKNLVKTGCMVDVYVPGTGIKRRLVVFAEE